MPLLLPAVMLLMVRMNIFEKHVPPSLPLFLQPTTTIPPSLCSYVDIMLVGLDEKTRLSNKVFERFMTLPQPVDTIQAEYICK